MTTRPKTAILLPLSRPAKGSKSCAPIARLYSSDSKTKTVDTQLLIKFGNMSVEDILKAGRKEAEKVTKS